MIGSMSWKGARKSKATFSSSVQVTKEEEISFGALFKNCKSTKNGYKTRDYKDRMCRNVAVALLQILQPHLTTYMTSWQAGFVKLR